MKNILKIYKRDLKKIFTNSMAIILAVGIAVLPSLYAWFNIFANWDPYGSTGNMQMAVIIEDEGFKFRNVDINVGEEIKASLEANDAIDWQFVSKEEAMHGVEAGQYYAAIEIPSGFSESLTSIVSNDFKQPQITYYANEKKNAIATKITDKVVQTVQQEVNESFVTTVINVVSSIIDVVADATKSGAAGTFDDLQSKLDGASKSIEDIQKTLGGFKNVMEISKSLGDTVNSKKIQKLLDKSEELSESGTNLALMLQNSVGSITSSVDSALNKVSKGMNETADLLSGVSSKTEAEAAEPLSKANAKLQSFKISLETVRDVLKTVQDFLPIKLSALDNLITKSNKRIEKINSVLSMVEKAQSGAAKNETDKIVRELKALSADISEMQTEYKKSVQPVINDNLTDLIDMLRLAGDLISELNGDMPKLKSMADSLNSTLESGDDLVNAIDTLLSNVKKEIDGLSKKIEGLGKSEVFNTLKNMASFDSEQLGAFIACPVIVDTDKIYGIENYGSAMAPFYSTLAVWVGAMILIAVVKTAVKRKKEIGEVKLYQGYFGRMLTFLSFSLAQALIICFGDLYFLKIQCYHPFKFILAGAVAAVAFTVFIYSITYALGDIGKSIGIIMLVVQIGGSGGTFPIDVCPAFFKAIHPYLPFTFVVNAMRECVCGTYGNDYWIDLLKLCAYIGIGLIIGLGGKFLVKKPIRFFEKRVEETGLF